jgi:hypothetical protein
MRSAASPPMTRPLKEATPAAPNMVAAAIAGTPRSIERTMWKIGPEWAARYAKQVTEMAADCGVHSVRAAVNSRSAALTSVAALSGSFSTRGRPNRPPSTETA